MVCVLIFVDKPTVVPKVSFWARCPQSLFVQLPLIQFISAAQHGGQALAVGRYDEHHAVLLLQIDQQLPDTLGSGPVEWQVSLEWAFGSCCSCQANARFVEQEC